MALVACLDEILYFSSFLISKLGQKTINMLLQRRLLTGSVVSAFLSFVVVVAKFREVQLVASTSYYVSHLPNKNNLSIMAMQEPPFMHISCCTLVHLGIQHLATLLYDHNMQTTSCISCTGEQQLQTKMRGLPYFTDETPVGDTSSFDFTFG